VAGGSDYAVDAEFCGNLLHHGGNAVDAGWPPLTQRVPFPEFSHFGFGGREAPILIHPDAHDGQSTKRHRRCWNPAKLAQHQPSCFAKSAFCRPGEIYVGAGEGGVEPSNGMVPDAG
jgi:hypothetical protein